MESEKGKPEKLQKAEEPIENYNEQKAGEARAETEFDEKLKNAYTLEEAKEESIKRIRKWWRK